MATVDLLDDTSFTAAVNAKVPFFPDPARVLRRDTLVSLDDHILEPANAFDGRLVLKFADRDPRVVEQDGAHVWIYDGQEPYRHPVPQSVFDDRNDVHDND